MLILGISTYENHYNSNFISFLNSNPSLFSGSVYLILALISNIFKIPRLLSAIAILLILEHIFHIIDRQTVTSWIVLSVLALVIAVLQAFRSRDID